MTRDAGSAYYERAQKLASTFREDRVPRIVALLEEAAAFDHPEALYELGTWHHYGIGVPRDDAKAAAYWERATALGHVEASFNLAIAHERGIGVAPDPARAYELYARCAASGDVSAIYEVGRCTFYGIGTEPNCDVAGDHFVRARMVGHAEAASDAAEGDAPRRMPRPNVAGPFHATRGG